MATAAKRNSTSTPVEEMLFMSSINDDYEEMQEEESIKFATEVNMRRRGSSNSFSIDDL